MQIAFHSVSRKLYILLAVAIYSVWFLIKFLVLKAIALVLAWLALNCELIILWNVRLSLVVLPREAPLTFIDVLLLMTFAVFFSSCLCLVVIILIKTPIIPASYIKRYLAIKTSPILASTAAARSEHPSGQPLTQTIEQQQQQQQTQSSQEISTILTMQH